MIILEGNNNEHIVEVMNFLNDESCQAELKSNYSDIKSKNKYMNGVRFYYNVLTKNFVGKPISGLTCLRGVVTGDKSFDDFKEEVEAAISRYYEIFINSNNNPESYISSGMLSYLDFTEERIKELFISNKDIFSQDFSIMYLKKNNIILSEDEFFRSSFINSDLKLAKNIFDIDTFIDSFSLYIENLFNNSENTLDDFNLKLKFYFRVLVDNKDEAKFEKAIKVFSDINLTEKFTDRNELKRILDIFSKYSAKFDFKMNSIHNTSISVNSNSVKLLFNEEGNILKSVLSNAIHYSNNKVSIPNDLGNLLKKRNKLNELIDSMLTNERRYYEYEDKDSFIENINFHDDNHHYGEIYKINFSKSKINKSDNLTELNNLIKKVTAISSGFF